LHTAALHEKREESFPFGPTDIDGNAWARPALHGKKLRDLELKAGYKAPTRGGLFNTLLSRCPRWRR
jgi:hypothetical protein